MMYVMLRTVINFTVDLTPFTGSANAKEFESWLECWAYLRDADVAPELADFAIYLLSAVISGATCERLFSVFALFHTKIRNRLSMQKVQLSAQVDRRVKAKNAEYSANNLKASGQRASKVSRLVAHRERPLVPPNDTRPTEEVIEVLEEVCFVAGLKPMARVVLIFRLFSGWS
eukprot:GHVU01210512.1.p1 GENE.GHVU01210512.1~~GHVU01210512.1.p1  ORF type:complete len:173 (-),score=12.15 GHVU01210512.1:117-635(-)